jgi:adenine-specific DNA methylase
MREERRTYVRQRCQYREPTRAVVLWSNPGELVASPFGGVGSEPYAAVRAGRRGLAVELKPAYYRQALANLATVGRPQGEQLSLVP